MQLIHPPRSGLCPASWPLYGTQATRELEARLGAALPPHTLMQRAGAALARLATALAPHARAIWIACGPGNNGGDGLEAAAQLARRMPATRIAVSCTRSRDAMPPDAQASWDRALHAGVQWIADMPADLSARDLCIDALLGIGLKSNGASSADPLLRRWLQALQASPCPVLCVDIASGLDAETGRFAAALDPGAPPCSPRHTLALLTLQPGLFTGQGQDACGQVWFDDLGAGPQCAAIEPTAHLSTSASWDRRLRSRASHKGNFGDVAVLGGEGLAYRGRSMAGAAWLAALAALHAGAGRVMLALLEAQDADLQAISPWPEIMLRRPGEQDWSQATVVCGCGGGNAVAPWLAQVLEQAPRLVLDADGLNTVATARDLAQSLARRGSLGLHTILTPHPLEAARLLGMSTACVQADRLGAAIKLAEKFRCTAILKGSGTVIAQFHDGAPVRGWINPTGNARLATGGTGDVLAGLAGALWAQGWEAEQAAIQAVYRHGACADHWPAQLPFSASALATRLSS